MENQLYKLIDVCQSYNIENTFIHGLHYHGLIEIIYIERQAFINEDQIAKVEKYFTWHQDLDLNMPAIEVVEQLLEKISVLQEKVRTLSNQ